MTSTLRVGLMFGGRSVEHEVSVISARGVAGALDEAGLDVVPIGVTGKGRWLSPERSGQVRNYFADYRCRFQDIGNDSRIDVERIEHRRSLA